MGPIDGTVVPSAAGGSIPFLPQPAMRVLRNIKNRYPAAWCTYGFVNAFNPLKNWYDNDVVAIDTGITMLMAENARTGFIWETFMKNPEASSRHATRRIQDLLSAAGKSKTWTAVECRQSRSTRVARFSRPAREFWRARA